ncbi:hypothetical protein PBAL39_12388 [Pedobacter sp. BAL39]|uniref:hypothetical protein n=1 Tax=Pedobacter sp. BAL39 TaxID=391596 RepID=UPI000155AD91|nr:hypothetical protein [Pedobacter sp. BAL39]EDM33873.1 hypothetical protein PBAL39_12388 [Pedobacter sp. BAL39]
MKIQRIYLVLLIFISSIASQAQSTSPEESQNSTHYTFIISKDKSALRSILFSTNQQRIMLNADGTLDIPKKNGNDDRNDPDRDLYGDDRDYYDDLAAITYYDVFDGPGLAGKVKSVGTIKISYYDGFDGNRKITGRVKYLGASKITYYDVFDGNKAIEGKIKTIGGIKISYYDGFGGEPRLKGKIKTIGNTKLQYWGSFDFGKPVGQFKGLSGKTPGLSVVTRLPRM